MRAVMGASMARCRLLNRLAGVKCTRPSLVSALGETVAAFAAHIADALQQADSKIGLAFLASAKTCASLPEYPSARRVGRCGLSCGGSTACFTPRSIRDFIF